MIQNKLFPSQHQRYIGGNNFSTLGRYIWSLRIQQIS